MINIITDKDEINKLYLKFIKLIKTNFSTKIKCWVGFPAGSFEDIVYYSEEFDLWVSINKMDNRFWNGFGIGKPLEGKNNSLIGEINFPFKNINRAIAGAFGKDDKGKIYLLHRGKIGGGKKGVGKQAFIENFRGDFIQAVDGDKETNFCFVGELNSKYLFNQVTDFINEIKRFKVDIINEQPDFKFNNFSYTKQSFGKSHGKYAKVISQDRIHGIIVNALAKKLENMNFNVANDRNRDLFIYKSKKILTLFEIKTSCSTQDIYTAIGQIIVYSMPIKNKLNLVIVLPEQLNSLVEQKLSKLGIKILYYNWDNKNIKFSNLKYVL
jgi:hypothetical protein